MQDVNDNSPKFPGTYTADVPVDTGIGSVVETVQATDADTVSAVCACMYVWLLVAFLCITAILAQAFS